MLTFRIALGTGMVLAVGDRWLDPDGELAKGRDGKELQLFVGAIFFQPETTETIGGSSPEPEAAETPAVQGNGAAEEEEEESEDDGEVQSTPACYLVFAKPLEGSPPSAVATVRRVYLTGNVIFSDEEWPAAMAEEFVREEIRAAIQRNREALVAAAAEAQAQQAAAQSAAPAG